MRIRLLALASATVICASLAGPARAQTTAASLGLYAYPKEGQSADQQRTDESECAGWARDTTGVDPANPAAAAPPPQQSEQPSGVGTASGRGAVRGAARAGLIGNLAHEDASEWAAYGAAVGAVRGASRRQAQNEMSSNLSQVETQAQSQEQLQKFRGAFSVCMQGRNYTVGSGQ